MSDTAMFQPSEARALSRPTRRSLSAVMLALGALLVLLAYLLASSIPLRAHHDFNQLVQHLGGSISTTTTYPDTYRQMSANRRTLQNAYLGGSGLILLTAGAFGLARSLPEGEG